MRLFWEGEAGEDVGVGDVDLKGVVRRLAFEFIPDLQVGFGRGIPVRVQPAFGRTVAVAEGLAHSGLFGAAGVLVALLALGGILFARLVEVTDINVGFLTELAMGMLDDVDKLDSHIKV